MKQAIVHLLVFVLWNLLASAALLFLPLAAGLPLALLLSAALLWGYLLRAHDAPRRWATLRLRPLEADSLRWTLRAIPVLLALVWALGEVYQRLVPVPPEALNPFEPLLRTPLGRLSVALLAVAVAPILEEFFFRGLIQRTLERRWGAGPGIGVSAAVFALMHMLPWVFPLHLFLGLAFGYTVYATRSIWAGVALHAANNSTAMLGLLLEPRQPAPTPTLWEAGPTQQWWFSLAFLLLTAALGAWAARGLWEAGRPARLRSPCYGE